jgi:excisionase family DNA binding protein
MSDLQLGLETWLLKNTDQALRNQGTVAFGWIGRGGRNREIGQLIDRAMKTVLVGNGRLKRSATRGLEAKRREQSLVELCERHELPKLAMKHILRSIDMPLARGRISYFDMDQVAAIDSFVKDLISPQVVAKILGCTRRVVSGLIENGRLRGYALTGHGQGTQGLVPKADVDALLRSFESLPMSGETHSVYTVGTFSQREGSETHDVVERVLSGALTLANIVPGRIGVAGWRLHIRDLAKPQRRRPRWHKPPPDCMTMTEAAVTTSIHPTTLSYVTKLGFIRHSRQNPPWLDRESVEIFHRKHAKLSLFHRELGTSVRNIKPIARDLGVPLLFDTQGSRYEPIVARADIERLVGKHIPASPAAQDVWTRFKLAYEQGYSAFHMPMEIATWPQQIYLASRRASFSFVADEDRVLVTKTFSPNSRREWPAFDGNRELFVHALKGFTWSMDGVTEIASFSMQTDDDIKVVRLALDAVHWHIRKLIPIQEGRWLKRDIKRCKS